MIVPDFDEFQRLARRGNVVPVWSSVPADMLTPVSAYLNLTSKRPQRNFSFLLESVEGGEAVARYTYMGADPFLLLRYRMEGGRKGARDTGAQPPPGVAEITEISGGRSRTQRISGDIAPIARQLLQRYRPVQNDELPPFTAGAVGYMAYDLVSLREPVPLPSSRIAKDAPLRPMPDAILMFFTTLLAFDHVRHRIILVHNARVQESASPGQLRVAYDAAVRSLRHIEKRLRAPVSLASAWQSAPRKRSAVPRFSANVSKKDFVARVRAAKEYIQKGDIFQVVLSQRLETKIRCDAFEIYRALRQINPAPYLFFLRFGADCVLGSSPEMLVKVTGDEIEYRPIAGTRRRGKNPVEDKALEQELLADEKERAEHVMLVDLGRNDVGRVCTYGSVRVADLMFVERYSHVMHLVSSIRGRLRPGLDAWDALWACFPAGTVTGAPKVRAMQIISELEATLRRIYAGTVLYLDFSGNLNSCIAIRSIVATRGKAYVQAGAGIVADSVPEREYEETMNKAKAMLQAIEIAEGARDPRNR